MFDGVVVEGGACNDQMRLLSFFGNSGRQLSLEFMASKHILIGMHFPSVHCSTRMRCLSGAAQTTRDFPSVPGIDPKPPRQPYRFRSFSPVVGRPRKPLYVAKPILEAVKKSASWRDIEKCLESLEQDPEPGVLILFFEALQAMEEAPPHEFLCKLMEFAISSTHALPLKGLSDILVACEKMNFVDKDLMEKFAHSLMLNLKFSDHQTRDISRFILCLGRLYKKIGGVPLKVGDEAEDEDELMEADEEGSSLWEEQDLSGPQTRQKDLVQKFQEVKEASTFPENSLQSSELQMQSRYTDHLTDLKLQDPRPVSTAEMDFVKINPTHLSTKPDPVRYDKEDNAAVEDPKTRNSQLELVRLLGAELVSQCRDQALTPRETYEGLYGLCLMRYKRDTVMRKLIQRLRLPEYHQKLSLEELTNLVSGMSFIRFRHHRALLKISTELLHPSRMKHMTASQAVVAMRAMTDLDAHDDQFLTALGLKVKANLEHLSPAEIISALVALSIESFQDLPLANTLGLQLLSLEDFNQISICDLSDLLEVANTKKMRRDICLRIQNTVEAELNKEGRIQAATPEYLAAIVRSLGDLHCNDVRLLSRVLDEAVDQKIVRSFKDDEIVDVLHGVGRAQHGKTADFFQGLVSEALSDTRLSRYHIRHLSNLGYSLSLVKGMVNDESSAKFWSKVLEVKNARRYLPGMLADLLEAARKMRVKDMEVYSNITYRLTQRHRLDFMTLAQFVRVIETLGKLRVGESVKDKQALKILFKEFIRPSKAKYLTTHQLPLVMRAILDLKYSERRRVEFLAMEVRHTPRHVPLWSDIDLQIVWRGFKHYACEDKEALRLVRKEMMFRDLPLRRRPPYM